MNLDGNLKENDLAVLVIQHMDAREAHPRIRGLRNLVLETAGLVDRLRRHIKRRTDDLPRLVMTPKTSHALSTPRKLASLANAEKYFPRSWVENPAPPSLNSTTSFSHPETSAVSKSLSSSLVICHLRLKLYHH